jgi:hypothetical protein
MLGWIFCRLCFFSGNVAACAASSSEERGKIRINLPMVVSPIGDLLYLAVGLAVVVVLWPQHGVRGEIFCFSTSSSVVVFVGGGLVLAGMDFVTNENDMASVPRNLFYSFVYVGDVDLAGVDLWSLVYQHVVKYVGL